MRYLFLVVSALFLLSCKQNDDGYINIIRENNAYLIAEIETIRFKLHQEQMENPRFHDSLFIRNLDSITKRIEILKDSSAYESVYGKIKNTAKSKKYVLKFNGVKSMELDILRNNLLINTLKLARYFQLDEGHLAGTHCILGPQFKIWKSVKKDSVSLDITTWNQYTVVVDSIKDQKNRLVKYTNKENNTLSSIKYHLPIAGKSVFYGKVFYNNSDGKAMLLQDFKDTIQ